MDSTFLHDYRCDCGKLLFKGVVATSHIEIKCTRCGKINAISGIADNFSTEHFYTLFFDKQGRIVNTNESIQDISGYSKDEAVKMHVNEIIITKTGSFFEEITSAFSTDNNINHGIKCSVLQKKKDGQEEGLIAWMRVFSLGDQKYYVCICAKSAELTPEMKAVHDGHITSKIWVAAAGIVMEVLSVVGSRIDL